jgi:hypothetical protein
MMGMLMDTHQGLVGWSALFLACCSPSKLLLGYFVAGAFLCDQGGKFSSFLDGVALEQL